MISDKRNYMRFNVFLAPLYCTMSDRNDISVTINDVSGSGIGIVTNERIKKGDSIDLELAIPRDDIPVFAKGEITWVAREEGVNDTYRAGVRLIKLNRNDKRRLMRYINSSFSSLRTPENQ